MDKELRKRINEIRTELNERASNLSQWGEPSLGKLDRDASSAIQILLDENTLLRAKRKPQVQS